MQGGEGGAKEQQVRVIASITTKGGEEEGGKAGGGPVVMALGKAELEALYDNLETIQQQLDALTEKQHA